MMAVIHDLSNRTMYALETKVHEGDTTFVTVCTLRDGTFEYATAYQIADGMNDSLPVERKYLPALKLGDKYIAGCGGTVDLGSNRGIPLRVQMIEQLQRDGILSDGLLIKE